MKKIVKPKELPVHGRVHNFDEVVTGYTEEEMLEEALRCIQCKNPTCISGCPVGIDIKKFIYQLTQKDYLGAYKTIYEKNRFPLICGRVCPAEYQCRKTCVFTPKKLPFASENAINIPLLERFAGDYAKEHISNKQILNYVQHQKGNIYKVACIGSGPASLTVAGELSRYGIKVDIYEGLHSLGGVLSYGIPTFRLPREVLYYEINLLKNYGVEFYTGVIVGRSISFQELRKKYNFVFIGTGAGAPVWLNIKGENLINIYSANEYLTRVNLMRADKFPEYHTPVNTASNIVVIGGGNTAMDAARVALRIQKINKINGTVTVLYRRTEEEMPARRVEIEHAKEEGVEFNFLVQPVEFIGNDTGKVKAIKCLKCTLGEPDETGRRKPVPVSGTEFLVPTDLVIVAIGLKANQTLTDTVKELKVNRWGDVEVNPDTMETSIENVYAGGDIVGGEGTIIEAMGMGKKAAESILRKLAII
ncbi:MAG: NADPH-dependent glutamate synthase [Elusimicrobiota bacterium]|nr:NADPH-dependent glutamate synthase [Elusimicrobiota bacterium]